MINRQAVLEYLNQYPSHTTWQMRLHFLQATREIDSQSSISISSIANQLNYILRDLESIGTIAPAPESITQAQDVHRSEYRQNQLSRLSSQD
jgi:hypothetical protein